MPDGKTNTQRIEILESQAANLVARLDVHETRIDGILEVQRKSIDSTEGHESKITVIEQKLLVCVEVRDYLADVSSIRQDVIALKKDLENLLHWKADQKKDKDEAARRLWAFGPNITAALIAGFFTSMGVGISVGLNYWLNRAR